MNNSARAGEDKKSRVNTYNMRMEHVHNDYLTFKVLTFYIRINNKHVFH